jgi:hypothetical protein
MSDNYFESKIDALWEKRVKKKITQGQFIDLYRSVITEWDREIRRRKAEKRAVTNSIVTIVAIIPALIGSGKLFD